LNPKEITKELGKMWQALTKEEKQNYKQVA
jgi:hypothetical protein